MAAGFRAIGLVALILMGWIVGEGIQAQLTFSKDWNPGKRTGDDQEFHGAMKTATTLYRMLANQIRQLAACDTELEPPIPNIFPGRR